MQMKPHPSTTQSPRLNSHTIIDLSHKHFSLPRKTFLQRHICSLMVCFLSFVCCLTIYEYQITRMGMSNETSSMKFFQFNFDIYSKIPVNYLSMILLILLAVILIILDGFSIPLIFNCHSHIHRFESAAVFGLIALEFLDIRNYQTYFRNGPLVVFIYQIGIISIISLRYFPILALFERNSSRKNLICYALGLIYFCLEILSKFQSDIRCSIETKHFLSNALHSFPRYYYLIFLIIRLTILFFQTLTNSSKSSRLFYNYVKFNLLGKRMDISYIRSSKLIICLYINALTLVYYLTISIEIHSMILTEKIRSFMNLLLSLFIDGSRDFFWQFHRDVQLICLITTLIISLQLYFSFKHYQIQLRDGYRGRFVDLPSIGQFSPSRILRQSMEYPGRWIGKNFSIIFSISLFLSLRFINFKLCALIWLYFSI